MSNVAGHAYRIPARKCFEDVMLGAFAATRTAKAFNGQKLLHATHGRRRIGCGPFEPCHYDQMTA